MAKDTNIGTKFTADVVDLKTGVAEVEKTIKQADKEFNKATAGMDKWSASSEGLEQKLNQLNTRLDAQKAKQKLYQAEIERVSKLEGEHSAELEQLNEKLDSVTIGIAKTEKEIRKYKKSKEDVLKTEREQETVLGKLTTTISEQENELKDLQNEYKDAVVTYGRNSKEAKNLARQIGDLSDDLEDNQKKVKQADKQLELLDKQFDDTGDSAEDFSKGLDGIKSLGATVGKGIATIGASVGALAGAFLATASETKEFRTNMGKLEAGFETSGLKAEQATETYKQLFSVVADEGKATEATAMLGQLAKSQEDLNKWVNISTGVYATFGDSLPIENLAEASLETSKTGKLTGGLADALNWAGISEEGFQKALDKCTTEQERQKLITETLNKTYDDASKKYQQVNKDVIESNKSQVELTETMAQIGEKAEPILTAVKDGFNDVLQAVLKLVEDVDFGAIAEKIKEGFAYFIDTIIPAIINGFQWIMDNKDILITGIVAIGTAMLAWNVVSMIQGIVKAIKGWTVATEGLTLAQKLMNLVMKANPIGIIISLIAGLVSAIVILWNKNEGFRNAVINIWNKVKEAIATVIEAVKTKFNEFKTAVGQILTKVTEVVGKVIEWFQSIPKKIKEKGLIGGIKEIGTDLVKGLWNGIKDMTKWITDKLKGFGESVLGGIKKFFGINSPSKEMAKIGNYLDEGLVVGIEKGQSDVINAGEQVGEKFMSAVSGSVDDVKKYFNDLAVEPEVEPVIEPKIDVEPMASKFDIISEKINDVCTKIGSRFSEIGQIINDSLQNQIDELDYELEKQRELEKQGLITQEELAKAEEETIKKKNALAKKQFNAQKANDIAQATIQGALAIMKGFAELGPIAGAVNAVIQGTITAAQIGTIASQKFVPMLAKGGIVNGPTLAMVGEAGKEAVMPLENNTGWIHELAEKLNEIMRKDFSFNAGQMQLNPAMAQSPVVNNYYYQTIQSPQQLNRREIYRDTKNLLSLKGM